jgi:type II secretory pathway component GspD/PulD (secretin)/TolA-binding protein
LTVAVRDEAMPRPPRPFHNAFLAILLAVGLPATVVLFGAVRARQLQSTANPRWARFAGISASSSPKKRAEVSSVRTPVQQASVAALKPTSSISEAPPDASFTGSVSGHRNFDASVQNQPIPRDVSDSIRSHSDTDFIETPPIIFRPVEDESAESPTTMLIGRLEVQLKEVRQRLESLSSQQLEQQDAEIRREQQLLAGLKNLNEISLQVRTGLETRPTSVPQTKVSMRTVSPQEPPFEPESAELESAELESAESAKTKKTPGFDPHVPSPKSERYYESDLSLPPQIPQIPQSETPSPLPTDLPEPEESAIRIRRSTGNNQAETYSIDIQDADIRQVFSQLSEAAEISIVPSPEIQGRISLNLHDVRFEAALNAIIRSRDYVVEREDGIMIVRTSEEAARRKHQNRQMVMKLYRPNYLSAAELNRLIEPLLSQDGRHSVTSPTSSQSEGEAGDDSGNPRDTVVVQDVPEVLQQIDQILVDVDVPPLQVRIEAKILRVRLSEGLKQGLDLGQLPCQRDSGTSYAEGGLKHANLACNVPTFIKSIERLADTSLVTSQRIQVLNKHRAEMLIGDRIGYQSRAGDDVQFLEAGTRLILRPSISTDGFIRLEIHPEHSTATVTGRKNPPRQNTSELTTHVMIRDGATVAIAGLIAEQAIETTKRLPFVSAIPIVGASFRHKKESLQRTELIMLVTPHIVIDCESEAEGKCLEDAVEERAAEFRDQQSHASRHNLARAHYERATCYLQQGNYVKARQQIDASLHQNKADLQALKLRNEINQCLMR